MTLGVRSQDPALVSREGGSISSLPLLQVRDLTVCYGLSDRRIAAVNSLNLDIAAGETVGLLGESGCGKTTLGLTLLKLLPAGGRVVRGTAFFRGADLFALQEREIQRIRGAGISMVYQEPGLALNPVIRVGSQIAEVLRAHTPLGPSQANEKARFLLEQVGFAGDNRIDEAYPHQLSGGQKQRVVIAQAIACLPALIIADEPTTALDFATRAEILTLLKTLQARLQLALLLISHDPGDLEQIVDRILVMYAGRVVEEGSAAEVTDNPLHPYTQGLLRARPAGTKDKSSRRLAAIPGEPPNPADLPAGCVFAARCPDARKICRSRAPEDFHLPASRRVACFNYAH